MEHGGDISAAMARYADQACCVGGNSAPNGAGNWLDLSTGIAPVPYPFSMPSRETWSQLPQRANLDRLLASARHAYAVAPDAGIVAAPGTQSLIQLLPRLLPSRDVAILRATYSEHKICWARSAKSVRIVETPGELATANVAVIVNPNNPDGQVISRDDILTLVDQLSARSGIVIVDEAFADISPEFSVASACGRDGLIVLRSFGKFYGLAGIRLGFALGPKPFIYDIANWLGPWALPGPTCEIGIEALSDTEWQANARQRYQLDARYLDALLVRSGHRIIGGTTLFRLTEHPSARAVHEALARHQIWTRTFNDQPELLRYGLPGSRDFSRLKRALDASCEEISNSDRLTGP